MAVSTLSFRAYIATLKGRRLGAFKRAAVILGLDFNEYVDRIARGLKCCIECRQWKDRGEFSADSSRWDGVAARCCKCHSDRAKAAHEYTPAEELSRMGPPRKEYSGDKDQARHLINIEVQAFRRPNPNDLFCAKCGHKGPDKRHEYHHHMGYAPEHVYDVVALCSACHGVEDHRSEKACDRERNPVGTFSGKGT